MGDKIPLDQRPSFESLSKKIDLLLPKQIQKMFVVDFQNDCACDIETYDVDASNLYYLEKNGISNHKLGSRFCCPMLPEISVKDVCDLLLKVFENAIELNSMPDCEFIIINNDSSLSNVYSNTIKVPLNNNEYVYFIPQPEYFGCLSVNLAGFGLFCFAYDIFKIKTSKLNVS